MAEELRDSLFERVVTASGLSAIFARQTVSRALVRAGVADPKALTAPALRSALPELRKSLQPYLEGNTDEALRRIEGLLRGP